MVNEAEFISVSVPVPVLEGLGESGPEDRPEVEVKEEDSGVVDGVDAKFTLRSIRPT